MLQGIGEASRIVWGINTENVTGNVLENFHLAYS